MASPSSAYVTWIIALRVCNLARQVRAVLSQIRSVLSRLADSTLVSSKGWKQTVVTLSVWPLRAT